MQAALLEPHGAGTEAVDELFTVSRRLSARERLRVYQHGYRLRLLRCLRDLHPGAVRLLGQDLFDRFALDFLDAHPSRSATLTRLDEDLAGHLERTRPDHEPGAPHEAWIDLLIDLVRFERAFNEVLDGPGSEEVLLELRAPVHTYLAAVRRGEDPPPPEPRPVLLSLTRPDHTVVVRELTAPARPIPEETP